MERLRGISSGEGVTGSSYLLRSLLVLLLLSSLSCSFQNQSLHVASLLDSRGAFTISGNSTIAIALMDCLIWVEVQANPAQQEQPHPQSPDSARVSSVTVAHRLARLRRGS